VRDTQSLSQRDNMLGVLRSHNPPFRAHVRFISNSIPATNSFGKPTVFGK
jgi:hypothetical protein